MDLNGIAYMFYYYSTSFTQGRRSLWLVAVASIYCFVSPDSVELASSALISSTMLFGSFQANVTYL